MGRRWKRPTGWPANAVALLQVDGHPVYVSIHAARRWAQRVRHDPRRRLKELAPDMRRIAEACGEWTLTPPAWWVPSTDEPQHADAWLTFGPDIAMPVRKGMAMTTAVSGTPAPAQREWRRARRQARAAARRAMSKARGPDAVTRKFPDKYRHSKVGATRERRAGNAVTMPTVPETGGDDGRERGQPDAAQRLGADRRAAAGADHRRGDGMNAPCRACKAPMTWALTVNGKRQPFDPEPTEEGTYLLEHKEQGKPPIARHQDEAARETLRAQAATRDEPLKLFVPHHATCPERAQFRRKGKRG